MHRQGWNAISRGQQVTAAGRGKLGSWELCRRDRRLCLHRRRCRRHRQMHKHRCADFSPNPLSNAPLWTAAGLGLGEEPRTARASRPSSPATKIHEGNSKTCRTGALRNQTQHASMLAERRSRSRSCRRSPPVTRLYQVLLVHPRGGSASQGSPMKTTCMAWRSTNS